MREIEYYLKFCKKIGSLNIPEIKFKEIPNIYESLYTKYYNITTRTVNRATLIVSLFSFGFIASFFKFLFNLDYLLILILSLLMSLFISYKFNIFIYENLKKKENSLNSVLYFIKIDYSLLQSSLNIDSDGCLDFIRMIIDYKISISKDFKKIYTKIQSGYNPERLLENYLSPSKDFNSYLNKLLINRFKIKSFDNEEINGSLEENFRIYLKQIASKISIIFFITIFFPIGLSFIFMLFPINSALILILLPIYYLSLKNIFNKSINMESYLVGYTHKVQKQDTRKFQEFLKFINRFALYLGQNLSPEEALLITYRDSKDKSEILCKLLENDIIELINFEKSFLNFLMSVESKLKSKRYSLIIQSIVNLIEKNSYLSSEKLFDIIKILKYHQKLSKKFDIIIKGEKIKVYLFLFLLPIILGSIGSLLIYLPSILNGILFSAEPTNWIYTPITVDILESSLFLLFLFITNSISSHYILLIIFIKKKPILIILAGLTLLFTFMISMININTFFI